MRDVLTMTDKLKRELPQMLEEHRVIGGARENLIEVAKSVYTGDLSP
jgi:hypothetical protein